ncbi:F-box/WD repeat-containing protein 2-like [Gigantopelta aegis]|uniref:F-box/WD repeat-containing protein 2-like n=1 Tax=Gigantopelta aegis TaxID=1735272 RepID=UPI001B88E1AD|nr:F-box/WD repeat-containing protein 2-like [Gigantopelta aegis]
MQDEEFCTWLRDVGKSFKTLTECQKNKTFDHLIAVSGSKQMQHLSTLLPQLVFRDFICMLPPEICLHILSYLDGPTLLKCCLVSRTWLAVVDCSSVWHRLAHLAGAAEEKSECEKRSRNYKALYVKINKYLRMVSQEKILRKQILIGHEQRVMAVYYKDGILATGSDEQSVRLWKCSTGKEIFHIRLHQTVSDIKFTSRRLYVASFDGTAACWDILEERRVHLFVGHTSAVFSLDVDEDLSLLVTGSCDKTIKLWSYHDSPFLVQTLPQHNNWVTKVKFLQTDSSRGDKFVQIVSVSKYIFQVWKISSGGEILKLYTMKSKDSEEITSFLYPESGVFCMSSWNDRHLTSTLTFYALTDDGVFQTESFVLTSDAPLRSEVLGIGRKFAVLIGPNEDNQLVIFNLKMRKVVASIPMPCRMTRNGAALSLGDQSWLDGFSDSSPKGTFLAACLSMCNDVLLLSWKAAPS